MRSLHWRVMVLQNQRKTGERRLLYPDLDLGMLV